jgi:hypothetical protein
MPAEYDFNLEIIYFVTGNKEIPVDLREYQNED